MQLLLDHGTETRKTKGISLIKGKVHKFGKKNTNIGWKNVEFIEKLKKRSLKNNFFYFIHAYFCNVEPKYIYAYSNFKGKIFPSIIKKNNIIGIQFHPEKSGMSGLIF